MRQDGGPRAASPAPICVRPADRDLVDDTAMPGSVVPPVHHAFQSPDRGRAITGRSPTVRGQRGEGLAQKSLRWTAVR